MVRYGNVLRCVVRLSRTLRGSADWIICRIIGSKEVAQVILIPGRTKLRDSKLTKRKRLLLCRCGVDQ